MLRKKSTKRAVEKYLERQSNLKKPKRKNGKPEKIVEQKVMQWLKQNSFDCDVVESKAVYSATAGRFLNSQTTIGFPDICGNDCHGNAVFIELKAPGKLSTLRLNQRMFLQRKIVSLSFACCVDSPDMLARIYFRWKSIVKQGDKIKAKQYLLDQLPKEKVQPKGESLKESETPF